MTSALNVDTFSTPADTSSDYYYRYQQLADRAVNFTDGSGPSFSTAFTDLAIPFYGNWRLISQGPDGSFAHAPITNSGQLVYDATNGTISPGNIFRSQRFSEPSQPIAGSPGLIGPH
jgi:hypothetical protein